MAIPWIVAHGEVTTSGVKTDTKSPFHRRSRKDTPPTRSSKKLEFPTNCNDFIVDQRPSERWFPCGHGSANAENRTPGIGLTRIPLNRPGFPGAVHFGSVPFSPSPLRHRSIVLRQHHPPAFRFAASLRSVPNRPPQGPTSSPSPALPPGIPPSCRAKPTSTSARAASRPGFPLQSLSPPLAARSACRRRPPPPIQGLPSGSSPRTTADRHTATASSHAPPPSTALPGPRWPDRPCAGPWPWSPLSGLCSHTPCTKGAGHAIAATACEGQLPDAMNPAESTSCRAGNGSDHLRRSTQLIDMSTFRCCEEPLWSPCAPRMRLRRTCAPP